MHGLRFERMRRRDHDGRTSRNSRLLERHRRRKHWNWNWNWNWKRGRNRRQRRIEPDGSPDRAREHGAGQRRNRGAGQRRNRDAEPGRQHGARSR
jgi:hypothetical protein